MDGEVQERHLLVAIVIEAYFLGTMGLIMSLAFLIFNIRFRNNRMIKMTSPNLNVILAGGGIVLSACCAMFGLDYFLENYPSSGSSVCQVRAGLLACGFSLLYGPMLAKAWRVYRLFKEAGTRRVIIRDSQLMLPTCVLVLLDVVLVVVWQLTDPLVFRPQLVFPVMELVSSVHNETSLQPVRITGCAGESAHSWLAGFLLLKMALLSYGLFLSWQTRSVALPSMNDSRCIVVSTMTTITMATFSVSISYLLHDKPNAVYACVILSVWICATIGTSMAFVPKMALWWRNPEGKGIRMSVSSSTCSACSVAVLHSPEQLEEELGQAVAENEVLRKSLEERETSIRELQQHLNSAQTKLGELGLNLDQRQDSGLDADLSSTDTDSNSDNRPHTGGLLCFGNTALSRLARDKSSPTSEARSGFYSDSTSSEPSSPSSQSRMQGSQSTSGQPYKHLPPHCPRDTSVRQFQTVSSSNKYCQEDSRLYNSLQAQDFTSRCSSNSDSVHSLSERRSSVQFTAAGRRDSVLTDGSGHSSASRRSSSGGGVRVVRDTRLLDVVDRGKGRRRQSGCLGEVCLRGGSVRRQSDTAVLGRRRMSRSETSSERGSRHRRHNRRRHSATSIASLGRLSTIRDSIVQDLKHARSLSNLLCESFNKDLDSNSHLYRRHARRRSSSLKSREDLAESIVESYGLEDDSDTRSYVSSFLPTCLPPPATDTSLTKSPDVASVLANDSFYPDRRRRDRIRELKLSPMPSRARLAPPRDGTQNAQRVYTIQTARKPEFHHSGYAQTRVLYTSDTFI